MIRIEADATQSSHLEIMFAPVRLITNQSKIRVTLKRRVSQQSYLLIHELTIGTDEKF